jgi:hypothetical protein
LLFIVNGADTAGDPTVTATVVAMPSADARFSAVVVKP